jgi:hypothetical protein
LEYLTIEHKALKHQTCRCNSPVHILCLAAAALALAITTRRVVPGKKQKLHTACIGVAISMKMKEDRKASIAAGATTMILKT